MERVQRATLNNLLFMSLESLKEMGDRRNKGQNLPNLLNTKKLSDPRIPNTKTKRTRKNYSKSHHNQIAQSQQ